MHPQYGYVRIWWLPREVPEPVLQLDWNIPARWRGTWTRVFRGSTCVCREEQQRTKLVAYQE